ncbi:MAG: TRAP transporter large permease [Pseudomonadota bacterium]|nr:MAG: C4-dicarboxylate ABC transporter permease [Pseudomonadota bacterium]
MSGTICVIALLVLLTLGVPIGVAMGMVGMVGLILLVGFEPAVIKSGVVLFETVSRYELGVLPLFLLMAHLCFAAGASRDFFDAAARIIGHRRGGLALASIGGCAGFGAISGSSLATAATIGLIALPEMRKRGYSDALATGSIAAGGTLGSIIPPSGALIVFGILAEQSIGTLFTAAIVPGITQALFYMITIMILCRWRPSIGPATEKASWAERRAALLRISDIGGLIVLVIGGIALGWFTPTEAASLGAVGSLLLCVLRRKLTAQALRTALAETLRTAGMIYVVIIGALLFSVFMSFTGLAEQVSSFMNGLEGGRIMAIIAMTLMLLLLGSVLDGLALMLLTTPILLPIVIDLGLSPIWFGVYLVRTMEIGFIHPPVGINLYVIQSIAPDVTLSRMFKGVLPFLAADFLHLALLIAVPGLALALPEWLGS